VSPSFWQRLTKMKMARATVQRFEYSAEALDKFLAKESLEVQENYEKYLREDPPARWVSLLQLHFTIPNLQKG
jgi:hypothetical protein